jgi:hypothetical protein
MTIENINPAHIREALDLLQNKIEHSSAVGDIAKGKYFNKVGVIKTKIINYGTVFILISTIISGIIWLMRF